MRVFQFVGDTSFDPGTVPIYEAAVSHPDPAGAFDQALACSPKRKRLLAEADAARAQAKVAKASALPQLSAQMSYNQRSEERRVGKECVSTCRSRWSPYH